MNSFARHTERDPAFHVLELLDANGIEAAKSWLDHKTKAAEARFRSFRQPGVDQGKRKAAVAGLGSEVRPHLGFHQNDAERTDQGKGPAHDRPEIERTVENLHLIARFGCRDMKAGSRRGGEHAEKFRIELPELRSQFQGNRDFADANGVDPGAAARAETHSNVGIIKTEALSELMPVISPPEQLG